MGLINWLKKKFSKDEEQKKDEKEELVEETQEETSEPIIEDGNLEKLPEDFDIFLPFVSLTKPWIKTVLNGILSVK